MVLIINEFEWKSKSFFFLFFEFSFFFFCPLEIDKIQYGFSRALEHDHPPISKVRHVIVSLIHNICFELRGLGIFLLICNP